MNLNKEYKIDVLIMHSARRVHNIIFTVISVGEIKDAHVTDKCTSVFFATIDSQKLIIFLFFSDGGEYKFLLVFQFC